MKLTFLIAFRNLFRQKGRSILMGIGICLSVVIIFLGYSFSKGISLNIVNKLMDTNSTGYLYVNMVEKSGHNSRQIIRDKNQIIGIIKERIENVKDVREALVISVSAIGNGKGSMLSLTGFDEPFSNILGGFELISGDFSKFENGNVENPLILEHSMAEALRVKVGDIVRIRLRTLYGQIQTARLTLVAIVESNNPLTSFIVQGALPLKKLKMILGYRPDEAQLLNVVVDKLDETGEIVTYGDYLHDALTPEPVVIGGTFNAGNNNTHGILAGFKSDEESVALYKRHVSVLKGDIALLSKKNGTALLGKSLAEMLEIDPGMHVLFSYTSRFNDEVINLDYEVAAIIDDPDGMSSYAAIINERDFYDTYLNNLPEKGEESVGDIKISPDSPLMPALAHSWKRAARTYTNLDYNKKRREIRHASFNGAIIDVATLQEFAEDVFQLETVINLLSLVAMLIVFSITLVGVLNTVRMTIRDRTQEIGTVRALGMQKKLVVRTLVTEIGLLSLFAALFGIILSYVSMDLLSMLTFPSIDINIDLMLDNGHLKFLPATKPATISIFVIISLTILTAWFPSKKAAKTPVAEALGHYE